MANDPHASAAALERFMNSAGLYWNHSLVHEKRMKVLFRLGGSAQVGPWPMDVEFRLDSGRAAVIVKGLVNLGLHDAFHASDIVSMSYTLGSKILEISGMEEETGRPYLVKIRA